ncbi:MAG: extracellular solute-binding protein [Oscillospiraceae bacterium]|nr:extracellular solute-binding protein [Oscillospiraceae bacterium]
MHRKDINKILAGLASVLIASAVTGCSSSDGQANVTTAETQPEITTTSATEWTGDNIEVAALDEEETVDVDINGKTMKWLGIYDLNPTNSSPERSPELALFEDTYGAKIQYIPTTSEQRFDDLSTAILGGSPPDIFIYEWRSFPYDISKGQYQPIDDLIDWEEPKWASVKDQADKFIWKGEHYIAPLGYAFSDTQVLMYNTTTMENEGFDDPYELYLNDEWTWSAFIDMMKTYVEDHPDEEKYGIGGWWANAFVFTAGDTMVTYDGNKFTNNLRSAKIEKAQAALQDIFRSNVIKRGWIGPEAAFVDDSTLFYAMGTWAYNAAALSRPNDVIQIVPFPRPDDGEDYYVSNKINSYMWVKGSENGDCVKAWLECNRTVNYEDKYLDATKEKFLANSPGWTSEMYDLAMDFYDPDKFIQTYDYGYGLSTFTADTLMPQLYEGIANEQFEDWVSVREQYYDIMDEEIKVYE